MAKIVQSLTRASKEYEQRTFQSLVRDLDSVITKLNTSFQEEVKQEIEPNTFFLD
jgi:predicted methyltransferase